MVAVDGHQTLLQQIEDWTTALDVMAVFTTDRGAIQFANAPFRMFFGSGNSLLTEIEPFRQFFGSPTGNNIRARAFGVNERSLLAVEVPFSITPGERELLFLMVDVDRRLLEADEFRTMKERMELLEKLLDASTDALQFVNRDGIITFVNRSYEQIHHVKAEDVIGKHVTDVIENTRMHIVATTGVPEIGELQLINKRRYMVNRIPVFRNNECIGAVGIILFVDLDWVLELANRVERLKRQLEHYRQLPEKCPDTRYSTDDIVAVSPRSAAAKATTLRVSPTDSTVLLLGETGVGKEVYAHVIHATSLRCRGPFIRVNCSAIVESLFESELFGYAEGAFTGARKGGQLGKFELANFGTILLDEIADMPLESQAKVLRVLQEQEVEKLGAGKQVKVDVRVIASTNQNLAKLVEQGKFRKDLFYRINVIPIALPALRERTEDIQPLVSMFWDQLTRRHGVYYKNLSADAVAFLESYSWPGNVRELRNLLERALAIVREDTITAEHLRVLLLGGLATDCPAPGGGFMLQAQVEIAERRAISVALARSNNNRVQAAKLLGITRPLLYKKMHLYSIQ